jgi:hypothetical protein
MLTAVSYIYGWSVFTFMMYKTAKLFYSVTKIIKTVEVADSCNHVVVIVARWMVFYHLEVCQRCWMLTFCNKMNF